MSPFFLLALANWVDDIICFLLCNTGILNMVCIVTYVNFFTIIKMYVDFFYKLKSSFLLYIRS